MASAYGSRTSHSAVGRSAEADDPRQPETGDLLNGVGSASSHNSTTSSVFSTNADAVRQNGKMSAYASTPLTSSDASPPKIPSPLPSKSGRLLGAASPFVTSVASGLQPPQHMSTTTSSTPHDRPQARPSSGEAKGYRAVWDPELDSKLGKEDKRKMKPKTKSFGTEVCLEIPIINA